MDKLIIVLIIFVAIEHTYFLVLEMFLWTKPKGIKTFGLKSKEFAEETKVLAANQGLYNGFLTAGLIYAVIVNNINFAIFFLICVTIAGIYG
jgi:putative membrane protein